MKGIMTYRYDDGSHDFTYESDMKLGSWVNFSKLISVGTQMYGKHFPFQMLNKTMFYKYKEMIKLGKIRRAIY